MGPKINTFNNAYSNVLWIKQYIWIFLSLFILINTKLIPNYIMSDQKGTKHSHCLHLMRNLFFKVK